MTINEERDLYATLVAQRDEALRLLRLAKAAHLRAEQDATTWKHRAVGGVGTVAIVLVLLLVWAVIA